MIDVEIEKIFYTTKNGRTHEVVVKDLIKRKSDIHENIVILEGEIVVDPYGIPVTWADRLVYWFKSKFGGLKPYPQQVAFTIDVVQGATHMKDIHYNVATGVAVLGYSLKAFRVNINGHS